MGLQSLQSPGEHRHCVARSCTYRQMTYRCCSKGPPRQGDDMAGGRNSHPSSQHERSSWNRQSHSVGSGCASTVQSRAAPYDLVRQKSWPQRTSSVGQVERQFDSGNSRPIFERSAFPIGVDAWAVAQRDVWSPIQQLLMRCGLWSSGKSVCHCGLAAAWELTVGKCFPAAYHAMRQSH